jgi:hypothetical protein
MVILPAFAVRPNCVRVLSHIQMELISPQVSRRMRPRLRRQGRFQGGAAAQGDDLRMCGADRIRQAAFQASGSCGSGIISPIRRSRSIPILFLIGRLAIGRRRIADALERSWLKTVRRIVSS